VIEAPAAVLLWLLFDGAKGNGKRPAPRTPAGEKETPVEKLPDVGAWPRAVPKGGEVSIKQTGGQDIVAWRRLRYRAAVDFLSLDDRSINAMTELVDQGRVEKSEFDVNDIALSVVAHWDIETASGTKEFNYNVGGIFALPKDQYFKSLDVQSNKPVAFCAYNSLVEGIADYFGFLSYERYASALAALLMLPTDSNWFSELGWAGYYGMDPVRAAQILDERRAMVAADVADLIAPSFESRDLGPQ